MKKKDYFEGKKVFEVTEEQKGAVITKEEGQACRHRLEKRWFRRLVVLNMLIIGVVLAMFFSGLDNIVDWTKQVSAQLEEEADALAFVIAHEMAHIYYKHATLGYNLAILFSGVIPILGSTASRAREYSCDRLAQRLTGTDGIDAMLVLVIDRHLYKMVDKEDYVKEMREQRGFFVWIFNLLADHPVMSKRIVALAEGKGSGKLY